MLKYISTSIIAAIIITLNLVWGSTISWFLSLTIIAIILYFVFQLQLEDIVNLLFIKKKNDIEKDKAIGFKIYQFGVKWSIALKSICLSVVFLAGVACIYFTTNPPGKSTWFYNTDYYGLSNKGIAFDKNLQLNSTSTDSNIINGNIFINTANNAATIRFSHYFVPAFSTREDDKDEVINNIFATSILQIISLENEDFKIDIKMQPYHPGFFKKIFTDKKDGLQFNIHLVCKNKDITDQWNLPAPFQDNISIITRSINKGMRWFELLLNARQFQSSHAATYQILQAALEQWGDSYLLADYKNEEKTYKFFPGKSLFDNHFTVNIDGKNAQPNFNNSTTLAFNEKFYLGLSNDGKQLYVAPFDTLGFGNSKHPSFALYFDYPNTYILKSPGNQEAGNKHLRFITNSLDKVIASDIKEGFLFNTYQLSTPTSINSQIDYYTGKPNTALQINIADYNLGKASIQVSNKHFALQTQDTQYQYLFQLRDFSDNGFSTSKSILYLGIVFLSFILLQVYFPGKKLDRIEPIILMVIMALTTLRLILYWRVATFPPLEQISKHELESTLLNFDFNLGVQLPIPLTIILIVLMTIILALYRSGILNKWLHDKGFKIEKLYPKLKNINLQYLVVVSICFIVFEVNKKIVHIDSLTRLLSIVLPIIAYIYYSSKVNSLYQYTSKPLMFGGKKLWLEHLHAWLFYFFNNPTTFITLTTFIFLALVDRGFAILFFLFILLKNILINFLKKPLANTDVSIANRLFSPKNYWIYGLIALGLYLTLLSFKSLFYYLLIYKVWVVVAVLILTTVIIRSLTNNKKLYKICLGITILMGLMAALPTTNKWLDNEMRDVVKHVQYRASIIYQPIESLLQDNEYTSFNTQKIVETAENQWFINSYISKPYDNSATINLRPYSKIGVDYSTQTRDVVLARFVISEWGNFTMYLLLLLLVMPMIIYLIAYHFTLVDKDKKDVGSYTGLIPLLILFTITLFVWLTATNRFVFFGQDFPFLSLTSRVSVLLPLTLFFFTLIQLPTPKLSFKVDAKNSSIKYGLFIGIIAVFALTTVKKNELNNKNFSIVMNTTQNYIEKNLNAILYNIQDKIEANGERITYNRLIHQLSSDSSFINLQDKIVKDKYSASILYNLTHKPFTAFELSNPLFMVYDNGRYSAVYNKNLYLELSPIESRNVWQGSIVEASQFVNNNLATLHIDNSKSKVTLPYFTNNVFNNYQVAIIPKDWLLQGKNNVALLNITNSKTGNTSVFVYKNQQKNMIQDAANYTTTLHNEDIATIYHNKHQQQVGIEADGNKFAFNKWVNGKFKIIYPLRSNNFWVYSYANAIKSAYSNDSMQLANNEITLDYDLSNAIQQAIYESAQSNFGAKKTNYNFSVIAADGNGNIRYMNDYVSNRKAIDPNDEATIYALQRQQFFYSNARNERDQWGNRNLLNLYLGPGSSIKPITAASIASQLNAGWEKLLFTPTGADIINYAGLKLNKPWKTDEHYLGTLNIPSFIAYSSNFYHSLLIFLGAYTKEDFYKNNSYAIQNVLSKTAGMNNDFPRVSIDGQTYFFRNIKSKEWPISDKNSKHKSYFGNENSLIANGLELNVGLRTKDKDKLDMQATTNDKVNYVDSYLYNILSNNTNTGYLWSFPEESYFLQSDRDYKEIHQNFNMGLMTASLGGYPFRITPYKMLEIYLALMTQNSSQQLGITPRNNTTPTKWNIDATWQGRYNQFLANNIFTGMKEVITLGTAKILQGTLAQYGQYYFYAKTGTINEQSSGRKSSRRLIITISNKDLTQAENIGKAKVYGIYFATDNTQDFDWNLVSQIINLTMHSSTLQHYFQAP